MTPRTCWAALVVVALPASVFAQGTYVSASLVGDVVRSSHTETVGVTDISAGGEAVGFALRLGTDLGANWGVEVEFARPAEIESENSPDVLPAGIQQSLTVWSSGSGSASVIAPESIILPYGYRIRTEQRNTTLSAAAWVRQELSPRVSLVYIGGMGFHRTNTDVEFTFTRIRPIIGIPERPTIAPTLTETVTYGVRPFAGIGARIGMTDHVQLVPDLRLHGLEGGWLVRPAVGLAWLF